MVNNQFFYEECIPSKVEDGGNFILTNLDSMETFPAPYDFQDQCYFLDDIEAFENADVSNWQGEDCLRWAKQVCYDHNINELTVSLTHLSSVTGNDLMRYNQYDFMNVTGSLHSEVFHQELQKLLAGNCIAPSSPYYEYEAATSPYSDYYGSEVSEDTNLLQMLDNPEDVSALDRYVHQDDLWKPLPTDFQPMTAGNLLDDSQYTVASPVIKAEEPMNFDESSCDTVSSSEPGASNCSALDKISTNSRKRVRGPKNWEFVIRLLNDPAFNPEVIRWEDKAEGTFRFVNPSAIAQLWGQRANKPNLSYDNFARGLRYHYTTGALRPVTDRQLVYRCGSKAIEFLQKLSKKSSQ